MHKQLDGVVVSTPDHTHAVITMAAMQMGKNVYCEKPLAHSISETRALMQAALRYKVITQLGNQGHSFKTMPIFREWILGGAIGNVHTIHAFSGSPNSLIDKLPLLAEKHDVPSTLDRDLLLGPAQFRPYNPVYLPGKWRAWTPFGNGTAGDWMCHVVDPVFWVLYLGSPVAISATVKNYDPRKQADTFPPGAVITYEFPAKAKRGAVKLLWFQGTEKPPRPAELDKNDTLPQRGAVVMGDKGKIVYDSHGASMVRIIPAGKMKAYGKPPENEKYFRNKVHHEEWVNCIRTGKAAGSNFSYGGPLSELAMLANISMRLPGTRLEWDGAKGKFRNSADADNMIAPAYREGWKL
jgi:predicted dehydrogenase